MNEIGFSGLPFLSFMGIEAIIEDPAKEPPVENRMDGTEFSDECHSVRYRP
jgi:hypothetical protein